MPATARVPMCDFVIFGGTGDPAVRKLLPALYRCDRDGRLPDETRVIATARAGLDDDGYPLFMRRARSRQHGDGSSRS
jgi:glucose-6-phosphate 1-dehydrogenase